MRGLLVIALAVGCSYGPSFRDCDISCNADSSCPDGFTCGAEGFCRASGASANCDAVRDARADDAPTGTHYCAGAPAQCETIADQSPCGLQTGCGWTTPTCSFTDNCANHLPNTDCDGTPGCMTYVVQPYCRYLSGYCNGVTKAACESRQNCAFGGGCTGVAKPCGQLSTQSTCQAQAGCMWK